MRTQSNGGAVVTCDGFDLLRTSLPIPLLPYFGDNQSRREAHPRKATTGPSGFKGTTAFDLVQPHVRR
jgi:hypothetical protein